MTTLKQVIDTTPALAGLTYPQIAEYLAGYDMVDNPVKAAPDVPAPVTLKGIMAQVPPAEMAKVYRLPGFVTDLRIAIEDQDREYMGVLLSIAVADGALTAATAAKLQPMLVATVSDPAWSAQIPGPARWQAAWAAAGWGLDSCGFNSGQVLAWLSSAATSSCHSGGMSSCTPPKSGRMVRATVRSRSVVSILRRLSFMKAACSLVQGCNWVSSQPVFTGSKRCSNQPRYQNQSV